MKRHQIVASDLKDEKTSKGFLIRHGYLKRLFEAALGKKVSNIIFVEGKFKEYDGVVEFEDDENSVTFEIKEDKSCRRTTNICIEYFGKSGRSGIGATKADFWLELIHSSENRNELRLTLSQTRKVKKFVDGAARKESSLNWFRAQRTGDNNSAYSYLVKEAKFMDNVVDYHIVISRPAYMSETGVSEFGSVVAQKQAQGW